MSAENTPRQPAPSGVPTASGSTAAPPKKKRSIKRTFGATTLAFEAFVVFFGTLVAWGLELLPGPVTLVGGILLSLLLVVNAGMLRKPSGYTLGWALQAVILLSGFILPMMFLVGALFAGCWAYGVIKGEKMDQELRERERLEAEFEARERPA